MKIPLSPGRDTICALNVIEPSVTRRQQDSATDVYDIVKQMWLERRRAK